MVNEVKMEVLDWHRHSVASTPVRGNKVLVSYVVNQKETYGKVSQAKTRCVWPNSLLNNETKYLSRRLSSRVM